MGDVIRLGSTVELEFRQPQPSQRHGSTGHRQPATDFLWLWTACFFMAETCIVGGLGPGTYSGPVACGSGRPLSPGQRPLVPGQGGLWTFDGRTCADPRGP